MTGPGVVHGQFDGMAANATGLQAVSDQQAAMMSQLGSTLEGLATTFQGPAGTSMQTIGAQIHQQGMRRAAQFTDQSGKMSTNVQILSAGDEDNTHQISALSQLIF